MIPIIKIKIEQRGTLMIIYINKTIIRNRHQQGIIIIKTTTIRKMTTTMTMTITTMTPSDEETTIPAAKSILIKPQTNSNHHS